jgi:hypothetical protein
LIGMGETSSEPVSTTVCPAGNMLVSRAPSAAIGL